MNRVIALFVVLLATIASVPAALAQEADPASPSGSGDHVEWYGTSHEIISPRDAATGLPTGKRQHMPFTMQQNAQFDFDIYGFNPQPEPPPKDYIVQQAGY